jgi:hypothetical protein
MKTRFDRDYRLDAGRLPDVWKHAGGCPIVALCEVVKSQNQRESYRVGLTIEFIESSKFKANVA